MVHMDYHSNVPSSYHGSTVVEQLLMATCSNVFSAMLGLYTVKLRVQAGSRINAGPRIQAGGPVNLY